MDASHPPRPPAEELAYLWEHGSRVSVDSFLESVAQLSATDLAAVLHVDQHHRWLAGERPQVENYLQRFPEVCAEPDAVVDVIFHEYLIRERLGEKPASQEYADRFPPYAAAVTNQIEFHFLLHGSGSEQAELRFAASTVSRPVQLGTHARLPAHAQIGRAPLDGLSSGREVQTLLRKRLRLFAGITCIAFILYVPVLWKLFAVSWGTALYCAIVAEAAFIALLLSSGLSFSLAALRWIELCLFSGVLLYSGYQ